jgi:hypothetical protein
MRRVLPFVSAAVFVTVLSFAALAEAQATRTWVSGVGDDANPCSRTAPCKTFAGAISKTADGGEISVLDPGGFGAVTITKSITINGEGAEAGVLAAGTNGIIVNAQPEDVVTIRGLMIHGAGTGLDGIRYLAGKALHVQQTKVQSFTGACIAAAPGGGTLTVTDSDLGDCAGGGVDAASSSAAPLNVNLERVVIRSTSAGIAAGANAMVNVSQGNLSNNENGVLVDAASAVVVADGNRFAFNGNGAQATAGKIFVGRNTFAGNNRGIRPNGGGIISMGDNSFAGNGIDGVPTGNKNVK